MIVRGDGSTVILMDALRINLFGYTVTPIPFLVAESQVLIVANCWEKKGNVAASSPIFLLLQPAFNDHFYWFQSGHSAICRNLRNLSPQVRAQRCAMVKLQRLFANIDVHMCYNMGHGIYIYIHILYTYSIYIYTCVHMVYIYLYIVSVTPQKIEK